MGVEETAAGKTRNTWEVALDVPQLGTKFPRMSILPPKYSAVRVRLTQAERDVLVARALRSGVALSVIVRRAIRLYIEQSAIEGTSVHRKEQSSPSKFLSASDGRGGV